MSHLHNHGGSGPGFGPFAGVGLAGVSRGIGLVGLAGLMSFVAAGCVVQQVQSDAPPPEQPGVMPTEVREPPAPPPAKPIRIDAALQSRARETVTSAMADPSDVVRANAIESAQRTLGASAANEVLRGLRDRASIVRFAASIAAGDLKLETARSTLGELAYDPDPSVRLAARYGLHKLGDTRLSQEILLGLRDPRRRVRADTVLLLGLLGEKSAVDPLTRLLGDREPVIRLQVAEALWRLGNERGLEELVAKTVSAYPDEQIVAVLALAAPRDRRALGHVTGWLVSDYPELSLAATRAAGMLGSDAGYAIAAKAVRSSDVRQRGMAALALGDIGRTDAQPLLAPLLTDPSTEVRLSAATALLQLAADR